MKEVLNNLANTVNAALSANQIEGFALRIHSGALPVDAPFNAVLGSSIYLVTALNSAVDADEEGADPILAEYSFSSEEAAQTWATSEDAVKALLFRCYNAEPQPLKATQQA